MRRSGFSKCGAVAIDLFCGAGGLTCGLIQSGLPVVAGYDVDESCQYAYEQNCGRQLKSAARGNRKVQRERW